MELDTGSENYGISGKIYKTCFVGVCDLLVEHGNKKKFIPFVVIQDECRYTIVEQKVYKNI